MTTTKITTYEADAVGLVGSKLAEMPALVALLHTYAKQVQQVEDDGWSVLTQGLFDIDAGEGVQLDRIGVIIGQPRWDRSDADYQDLLNARIIANNSKATPENLLSVLTALLGDRVYTYIRAGVAYAQISWDTSTLTDAETERAVVDLIEAAKPAGVIITLVEVDTTITPPFIFGSTGLGWGSTYLNVRRLIDE